MTQIQASGGGTPLHDAVRQLIGLLDELEPFEPCRGPVENWPEEVRHRRAPVWDLWPPGWQQTYGQWFKESWSAYGGGWLLAFFPHMAATQSVRVPGSELPSRRAAIERTRAAPATSIPKHIAQILSQSWPNLPYARPETPEVIVRNDWHERRELVAGIRPDILRLVPVAQRAVIRVGGELPPLQALTTDDLLHYETIDLAIAQLNRALPPADAPDVAAASPGETPALMTGKQAAALIGVTESTLSRWRQSVPAWAEANPMLFRHLIDRDDGKHSRVNIRKLASWYAVAEEQGGQTAVDCP